MSYKRIWLQRYLFVQRLGVIQITEIGQSDHEIAIVPTKKSFGSKNTKTQKHWPLWSKLCGDEESINAPEDLRLERVWSK